MLETGDAAPDFTLTADDGSEVSLSDFRGKKAVLYFYPKDDTSGCTLQACELRDHMEGFDQIGAVVLGVSPDSESSHRKFKAKHDLNFPLLVDEDHAVAERYGVWKEKKMYGRTYMGIERSTFIIAEDGTLEAVWRKVNPKEHLARLQEHFQGA
jgi:peroxiredoxin Q/BCP